MIKRFIEKLKTLSLYFVSERCFKVTYKSKLNGSIGTIGYYAKSIDDVRRNFENDFENSIVLDVSYNVS
jgi:hypothetical protein